MHLWSRRRRILDQKPQKVASNITWYVSDVDPILNHTDFLKRIFHYADSVSWTLNLLSLVTSIGSGSALPLMTIVFGNSTAEVNDYGGGESSSEIFDDRIHTYM